MSDERSEPGEVDVVGLELAKIIGDASKPPEEDSGEEKGRQSVAAVLIEMAEAVYALGVSTEDEPYALPKEGGHIALLLRGNKGVRSGLARAYYDKHGKVASAQALSDALQVLDAKAHDASPVELHLRAADHGGATYIDMGDVARRAVKITPRGWEVVERGVPVLFRRTKLTGAFPEPERSGTLDLLWDQLNIGEEDQPLLAAFMVASLICPDVPVAMLALLSEQGTAKSSTTRCVVRLTDPQRPEFRKPPKDPDQWVTAANSSRVVALDNLSVIPKWLSDTLCRAATGDGDVRRALYTDSDVSVISFRRVVIMNGIDVGAIDGDISERALLVRLQPIPSKRRRTERELQQRWDESYPLVFGALLDLAAQVKEALPRVKVRRPPRMADFAHVLAAVDHVLGTKGLAEYTRRSATLAVETLEANPFLSQMRMQISQPFTGTMAELLGLIVAPDRTPRGWPANARALSGLITRSAPALKSDRWTVEQLGEDSHDKIMRWHIEPPPPRSDEDDPEDDDEEWEEAEESDPQHPQDPQPQVTTHKHGGSRQPGHTRNRDADPRTHPVAGVPATNAGTPEPGHPQKNTTLTSASGPCGGGGGENPALSHGDDDDLPTHCGVCGQQLMMAESKTRTHPVTGEKGLCTGCAETLGVAVPPKGLPQSA